MSMFIRRYLFDPGEEILLEIESVNILDLEPPASITGVGTGTALLVGEFENGDFATPTEVTSATELVSTFGALGYDNAGTMGNNPCAVSRNADAAVADEYWNGNGFVQLSGKKFRRLVLCRVDTSVGSVRFQRLAFVTGLAAFAYPMTTGEILALKLDAGATTPSTFTGAAAVTTGAAGTFTPADGDQATFGYDNEADFVVTFLATDNSAALMAARINLFAGFTFASVSGGQIRLTGRILGTDGEVRLVAGAAGILADLGLAIAAVAGTGNVANIAGVTFDEVKTIVELAMGASNVSVQQDSAGRLRIVNKATPLTGLIEVRNTTTNTSLGFAIGDTGDAAEGDAGFIPAGTRLRNTGATNEFVTMQDVVVTADDAGPYDVKVRHAVDDGTGLTALTNTIVVVVDVPDVGAYSVYNPAPLTAALTESQIDAAYLEAIDATLDPDTVAAEVNVMWSARQSNAARRKLRENALDSSGNGLFGRMAVVRPPMGTTKAVAQSNVAEPGVGATRDQRVVYTFPQVRTMVPLIAKLGTAGGAGFTADGVVDVGADGFLCSIMSQLPPEENPGQKTPYTGNVIGIESSPNARNFRMADYTNFKRAGICAPRMSGGTMVFQSGVTSVNPLTQPSLKNINRRRMADFIEDTIALRSVDYGKKGSTSVRRRALANEIRFFLRTLLSPNDPTGQRIAGYTVDEKTGNTALSLSKGLYRIIVKVRILPSLLSIVLAVTAGEEVEVEEVLAEAA